MMALGLDITGQQQQVLGRFRRVALLEQRNLVWDPPFWVPCQWDLHDMGRCVQADGTSTF